MTFAIPLTIRILLGWLVVMGAGLLVWLGITALPLSGRLEGIVTGGAVVVGIGFAVLVWSWVLPRKPRSI